MFVLLFPSHELNEGASGQKHATPDVYFPDLRPGDEIPDQRRLIPSHLIQVVASLESGEELVEILVVVYSP